MTPLIIAVAAAALAAALAVRFTVFNDDRVRRMRWRILFRLRPGPGFATGVELWLRWGRLAAVWSSRRSMPGLRWRRYVTRTSTLAVRLGRSAQARVCYATREVASGTLYLAPPRKGKSGELGDRVIGHPGAAVIHETRPDNVYGTAGYRARRGPVWVLNPSGIGGIPSTFGWDMIAGCEDPAEAFYRAADLVGAVTEIGEMQWWSEKARGALGAALHAAAIIGGTMADVWDWSLGADAGALTARASRNSDCSQALLATLAELDRPGKTADSIKITMTKSLEWLAIPLLRGVVTGPAARPFAVADWIDGCGTIYLISPGGDEAPTAPLVRCFMSYLHRHAKLHAQTQPRRRLDPTVLFAVDEIDKCPVDLPGWLADSAGYGIEVAAVVHSTGQLKAKYGDAGLNTVWTCSTLKIILGGNHDADTMRDLSQLGGTRPRGEQQLDPEIPLNFPWRLPNWRALVLNDNLSPVVVKFRPWWKRTRNRFGLAPAMPALTGIPAPGPAAPVHTLTAVPWPHPAAEPVPVATLKGGSDAA